MNEYKVTVTMRDNTGFFPDLFGHTETHYFNAESAAEIEETIRNKFKSEVESGEISLDINIHKI